MLKSMVFQSSRFLVLVGVCIVHLADQSTANLSKKKYSKSKHRKLLAEKSVGKKLCAKSFYLFQNILRLYLTIIYIV